MFHFVNIMLSCDSKEYWVQNQTIYYHEVLTFTEEIV